MNILLFSFDEINNIDNYFFKNISYKKIDKEKLEYLVYSNYIITDYVDKYFYESYLINTNKIYIPISYLSELNKDILINNYENIILVSNYLGSSFFKNSLLVNLSNLYQIITFWNSLNEENTNVKQVFQDEDDLF
jgi:hypothetical protein